MTARMSPSFVPAGSESGGWRAPFAGLLAGIAVTLLMFMLLGRSASVGQDETGNLEAAAVADPFLPADATPAEAAGDQTMDDCVVMRTALDDINGRMSEGVTEEQARYFRARRNKIYMLMRERCGI